MRYALIGCGRISPNHIEAAKNNNLEIVAICDLIPEMMKEKSDKFSLNSVNKYEDYKEMLIKEKPELVAIATESGNHAKIAIDCIESGCNVIIEKPIALSIKDADMIIKAGKEKGVLVCANHQNRFNKSVQYMRKAMEQGRFGRLLHGAAHVRWNRGENYYEQAPWRGTWAQDGGCLMNQCIHNIDLLRWMMGDEIDEVMAYTDQLTHYYIEAEDLGLALVKFKNGSYGIIEGTTNVYPKNLEETLYIFGEKGTAKAAGTSDNIIEEWNFADGLDDSEEVKSTYGENPPNVYGYGHTPLYADVIDAIINKREPYIDGEAGKRALELVLAIYKSSAEHRPVKLPLEDCSTMDFVNRFDN
ncbi:MAG: Gfo/Idh/MocA family oxidoreductase [Lachnospiraceae bacterium]|nr:Gfo/Idh/MocA family oxidoreductase [Lachnospiraceae bacterium]